MPISYLLAFKAEMGVVGLAIGMGLASVVQFVIYTTIIVRADWYKISREAIERVERENETIKNMNKKE